MIKIVNPDSMPWYSVVAMFALVMLWLPFSGLLYVVWKPTGFEWCVKTNNYVIDKICKLFGVEPA